MDLNERELAVIAALNEMYSSKHEYLYASISMIGYELTGKFLKTKNKRERNIISSIQRGIDSLVERNIIEIIDQDGDNYVFSNKGLEVDCEIEADWGEPEPIEQFNIEDTFEVETA